MNLWMQKLMVNDPANINGFLTSYSDGQPDFQGTDAGNGKTSWGEVCDKRINHTPWVGILLPSLGEDGGGGTVRLQVPR